MKTYYVYMMANKTRSVLYTGVSNSLVKRVWQHREGEGSKFTSRYNCNRLVYFESFRGIENAIAREKQIKAWRREKKEALIATLNPQWRDLAVSTLGLPPAPATAWKEQSHRSSR